MKLLGRIPGGVGHAGFRPGWAMRGRAGWLLVMGVGLLAAGAAFGQPVAGGHDPARQLVDDYDQLMMDLASPAATGVMILDAGPGSPIGAAGLRPGDIITAYDNKPMGDDEDLREAEAAVIKRRDADAADLNRDPAEDVFMDTRVPLVARRGAAVLHVRLPRRGLDVSAVGVEAGVPGPRNDPGTPRGELAFDWNRVPLADAAAGEAAGRVIPLKLRDELHRIADQTDRVTHRGTLWTLTQDTTPPADTGHVTQRITVTFETGDGAHEPAFTVDHIAVDAGDRTAAVDRTGRLIQGTQSVAAVPSADGAPVQPATTSAIGPWGTAALAIPGTCLPVVAGAMAHRTGQVVQFGLLSEVDFQTRLGYALVARGEQPIKGSTQRGWLVEVTHFGRTTMAFWFDDAGVLVRADFGNGLIGEP